MAHHRVKLRDYPQVARLIRAAAPNYRKHEATIWVSDTVELQGTYWDGGSRSNYTAVDMVSGYSKGAPHYAPPQFGGPRTAPVVTLPPNTCIIETGTFCGKPATAGVHVRRDNVTKLLPAGLGESTEAYRALTMQA